MGNRTEHPDDMPNELTKERFIAHLLGAGWPLHEAEAEWEAIQDDEEGVP